MSTKPNRNDRCNCADGKKHKNKKCYMSLLLLASVVDFVWQKLCKLESFLINLDLIFSLIETLPIKAMRSALDDYFPKIYLKNSIKKGGFINGCFVQLFLPGYPATIVKNAAKKKPNGATL